MKRTLIVLGLLFVSASASAQAPVPANSNAYREVLRIAQGVTFVDERTIERDDATARAWVLTVAAEDRTLPSGGVMRAGLTHYSFDCDARTSLPVRMAFVGPDLTVTETQVPDRPAAAIAAPLGDTLDLICGSRPAHPGLRATSLAAAVTQARAQSAATTVPPISPPTTTRLAAFGSDVVDGAEVSYFFEEASRRPVGNRSSGWIFVAFTQDRTISGQAVSSMWQLVEANCATRMFRAAGIAMIGPDLTRVLAQQMSPTTPAQAAAEGSVRRQWLDLACGTLTPPTGPRYASGADAVRAARQAAASNTPAAAGGAN